MEPIIPNARNRRDTLRDEGKVAIAVEFLRIHRKREASMAEARRHLVQASRDAQLGWDEIAAALGTAPSRERTHYARHGGAGATVTHADRINAGRVTA